jgi:hypothetical protein
VNMNTMLTSPPGLNSYGLYFLSQQFPEFDSTSCQQTTHKNEWNRAIFL